MREQVASARANRDEEVAKKHLTTAEYAAWHEFQQDLVNFQRQNGRRPPSVLRDMRPMNWVQEFRDKGRIDVKATDDYFAMQKHDRTGRMIETLKGL
jgi:hypothetical protein